MKQSSPKPKHGRPRALFRKYASAKPPTNGTFADLAESLRFMGITEFGQFAREVAGVTAPHFNSSALKQLFNEAASFRTEQSDGHRGLIDEDQFMYALRLMLEHAREHNAAGLQALSELCDSSGVFHWRNTLIESVFELCARHRDAIDLEQLRQMQASGVRRTPREHSCKTEQDLLQQLVGEAMQREEHQVSLCGFKKVLNELEPSDDQLAGALVQFIDLTHEVAFVDQHPSQRSSPAGSARSTPRGVGKTVEGLEVELAKTKRQLQAQIKLRTQEKDRRQQVGAGAELAQAELAEMARMNSSLQNRIDSSSGRWSRAKWAHLTTTVQQQQRSEQDQETTCATALSLTHQVELLRAELAAVEVQYESLVDRNQQLVREHREATEWFDRHAAMLQESFSRRQPNKVLQQGIDDGVGIALLVLAQSQTAGTAAQPQQTSVSQLAQLISKQADRTSQAQFTLQSVLERTVNELQQTQHKLSLIHISEPTRPY
eukprot:TRINITY_DN44894_c0_g1_i1.p1 TRINITY_DN44894_c0_g1~~TRINITY_DN44894_c0_g1_i1.p1  ORF type:complete len:489 (-),score=132.09 TRINITY_DN44894_c0_g1_i1:88-1554(-)